MAAPRSAESLWSRLGRALSPGSSEFDFCEPNYAVSPYVSEFFNTVSNLAYVAFPVLMLFLFGPYARRVSASCHVVSAVIVVLGLGSAYYHGTLSLAGQLVDQLAILWVMLSAATLWIPKSLLPDRLVRQPWVLSVLMALLTMLSTWLGCLHPHTNRYMLMSASLPVCAWVISITHRFGERAVRTLGVRSMLLFGAAMACWISDQVMCGLWRAVGFPYLHSIWHVLIMFAAYDVIVLVAYADTVKEHGNLRPLLKVWGGAERPGPLSIMYIDFKSPALPTHKKVVNKEDTSKYH